MKRFASLLLLALAACGSSVGDGASSSASSSSSSTSSSSSSSGAGGACGTGVAPGAGVAVIDTGALKGSVDAGVASWRGIPYAAAPVGDLRWKAPAAPACWEGTRDATSFGPMCPQLDANGKVVGSEDCLTLDVWAPSDATPASKLPVLVFIHGGAFLVGSASDTLPGGAHLYDGTSFAKKGVVLVTIEYRVGALGYLATPALAAEDAHHAAGNYATLDQIAALAWVKRNAAAFGGDPSRVLVFGESAGGASVCNLLASPLAAGLFDAAIIESGGCTAKTLDQAEQNGADVTKKLACDAAPSPLACLRQKSVAEIVATQPSSVDISKLGNVYNAVVDGWVLPDQPATLVEAGKHNHVPVILGSNTDETARAVAPIATQADFDAAVVAYLTSVGLQSHAAEVEAEYAVPAKYASFTAAMVALTSDVKFTCGARRTARALAAAQKEPVYRYVFGHVADKAGPKAKALGAFHGYELLFVFENLGVVTNGVTYVPGPTDLAIANGLEDAWTSLAASGTPKGTGLPAWTPTVATDPYLEIVDGFTMKSGYRNEECDFWHGLTGL